MNVKWYILALITLTIFSGIASSEAITGKIIIDGQASISEASKILQGNGNIITDTRQLSAFNKLAINIAADIEYIASDTFQLELTADDNIVPMISSTIRGNTLSINTHQSYSTQSPIRVIIYGTSSISSIRVDGSSDVNLQGVASNSLQIILNGTGDITTQGKVQNLMIKASGSGDIDTKNLQSDSVTITVDGSVDVTVTAINKLNVTIDGVSDVTYYGKPVIINRTIDGTGDISAGN